MKLISNNTKADGSPDLRFQLGDMIVRVTPLWTQEPGLLWHYSFREAYEFQPLNCRWPDVSAEDMIANPGEYLKDSLQAVIQVRLAELNAVVQSSRKEIAEIRARTRLRIAEKRARIQDAAKILKRLHISLDGLKTPKL